MSPPMAFDEGTPAAALRGRARNVGSFGKQAGFRCRAWWSGRGFPGPFADPAARRLAYRTIPAPSWRAERHGGIDDGHGISRPRRGRLRIRYAGPLAAVASRKDRTIR